jgi:hypothetical protein
MGWITACCKSAKLRAIRLVTVDIFGVTPNGRTPYTFAVHRLEIRKPPSMSKSILLPFAALVGAAVAGTVVYLALQTSGSGEHGSANATEIGALRSQVDDLKKEVASLRDRLAAQPAVASALPNGSNREAVKISEPMKSGEAVAQTLPVSQLDRDTVFALIKEERDIRDKERQEKQRQQVRDGLARRVEQALDRIGVDAATKESIKQMYLDNLAREEDIRKAYPIQDFSNDDPNLEKRRQELDAARKDLEARVANLIPADKKDEWDRRSRFLSRTGDFMGAMESFQQGSFPMMGGGRMGGMDFGPPRGGGFGGPASGGGQTESATGDNGGRQVRRSGGGGRGQRGGGAPPAAPAGDK